MSDEIGRKPVLAIGVGLMALLSYPLFLILGHGTFEAALIAQLGFAVAISFFYAAIPATLVEVFSTKMRYTAMSFPYNMANTVFGGTAPLVATYLIKRTGTILAPSFYLLFAGIVMFLAVLTIKETYQKPLE